MAKSNKKKPAKKVVKNKIKKPVRQKKILAKKIIKKIKQVKKPVKKILVKKKNIVEKKKVVAKKIVKKIVKAKTVVKAKVKNPVKTKIKKVSKKPEVKEFAAESLFKARIKVIGIGGGGGSIVSEIGRSLEKATFVVADTDIRALKKKSGIKYLWFGQELTHGLGTGVNVELAKQAAESAKEKISSTFKDQDIIIFIASLGGGLGSGATQVFAEAAREFGGITFGIFTMPFKFEGKNKQRIAQNALKALRKSLNVSLVIPNEKIFKIIDANTAITDAFSIVNKSLIESLESLIDLIYNPGIINIDFADLRTILRGRGNTAFLNTIEESGKLRAEAVCEKILFNPLLQDNKFDAEKILFNIAGSENLSMFEVEKISSHIANTNPKAKIIFGISKNSKLKSKIKTTILMTGGQGIEEILEKEPVVEKVITKEIEEKKEEIIKKEVAVEKKPEVKIEAEKIKPKQQKIKKQKLEPKKVLEKSKTKKNKKLSNIKHDKDKKILDNKEKVVLALPEFGIPIPVAPVVSSNRMSITEANSVNDKKTIRRSGLEIRKAEELQEKKRIDQEKEWEIPAFLRKVKFKN